MEQAWVENEDAKRRDLLYEDLILKAEQMQSILIQAYTTGGKDFEEILRLQRTILTYKLSQVKADRDLRISIAKMEMLYDKF